MYLECGGIWWLSSEPAVVMIREALTRRPKGSYWWNVWHVPIQEKISLMIGRKLDHCCTHYLFFASFFCFTDPLFRFLYILYLAVDANFKLKGKERNLTDIELMPGLVAYVPDAEYKTHVANYVDQPEVCIVFICE